MSTPPVLLGLHLGSTNSTISILNPSLLPEIIANADGERLIPSVVAWDVDTVGTQALAREVRNPGGTIRDPVGLMAKGIDKVKVTMEDGKQIDVEVCKVTEKLLAHLRETAATYIGSKIDGCVMSIPYAITNEARERLLKAADNAKLHVYQLVHEPIAAIAASKIKQTTEETEDSTKAENIVVVDVGGTHTTVTLVKIIGGIYTHVAHKTSHEVHGNRVTQLLVDHFSADFLKRNPSLESLEGKPLRKLSAACESVKKTLSQAPTSTCYVESLHDGIDLHGTIMRMKFDMLGKPVWQQFSKLVQATLDESKIDRTQINEVIFIGGGIRTPKVVSVIKDVFAGDDEEEDDAAPKGPKFTIPGEPDVITALGCGMQAALFTEDGVAEILEAHKYESPVLSTLTKSIKIDGKVVLVAGSALPAHAVVQVSHGGSLLIEEESTKLGEVKLDSDKPCEVVIDINESANVSLIIKYGSEMHELKLF